jgi:lipoprotein-anchoring transpeptidase ErfK/SrfK
MAMDKKNLVIIGGIITVIVILTWLVWPKKATVLAVDAGSAEGVNKKTVQEMYAQAALLRQNGEILEAKKVYQEILAEYASFEKIEEVNHTLADMNMKIIFSNTPTPQTVVHEVESGDTLGKLAKGYNTTVDLIKRSNNLKGDTIHIGQKLRIWKGNFNVFVDKSQNVLMLKDGDEVLKVYRVSTGANNSTPVGKFKITSKLVDPVWFNRGVVVPPDSPQNVLGSRWLGFDMPGYGIHGTIEPETIGQQVTAGCVRMNNRDVEELYSLLPVGTEIVIVD